MPYRPTNNTTMPPAVAKCESISVRGVKLFVNDNCVLCSVCVIDAVVII